MPWNKVLLAVIAMMVFGLNAVLSKIGIAEFSPFLFNFLRFAFVLPGVFFIARPKISWTMLTAIALVLSVIHLTFGTVGLYLGASAGTFVFIQQTGSIFAILFAYLLFKQKPTAFDIAGIALGLIGIYWICSSKGTQGSALAIAALVGSAVTWGLGFTLVKKAQAPSVPTTVWTSVIALPCLGVATGTFDGLDA